MKNAAKFKKRLELLLKVDSESYAALIRSSGFYGNRQTTEVRHVDDKPRLLEAGRVDETPRNQGLLGHPMDFRAAPQAPES